MSSASLGLGRLRDRARSAWLRTLADSLRYGRTRLGAALVAFVVALALLGPLAAPYAPDALAGLPSQPPSSQFLLGTDFLGHDVLSRALCAAAESGTRLAGCLLYTSPSPRD